MRGFPKGWVCAGVVAALLAGGCGREAAPAAAGAAPEGAARAAALTGEFERLKGRWHRPDGGYVIELRRLLPENALEAAYFNPGPIHVGQARLYKERGFTKVYVELRDVNYPGSAYTLIYDAEHDRLRGTYFQATQQETYEIEFERLPPEV